MAKELRSAILNSLDDVPNDNRLLQLVGISFLETELGARILAC